MSWAVWVCRCVCDSVFDRSLPINWRKKKLKVYYWRNSHNCTRDYLQAHLWTWPLAVKLVPSQWRRTGLSLQVMGTVMGSEWQTLTEMESIIDDHCPTQTQQVRAFVQLLLLHIFFAVSNTSNNRNNFDRTQSATGRKEAKKKKVYIDRRSKSGNCSLAALVQHWQYAALWSWFVICSQWSNPSGHCSLCPIVHTSPQFIRLHWTCDRARKKSISNRNMRKYQLRSIECLYLYVCMCTP